MRALLAVCLLAPLLAGCVDLPAPEAPAPAATGAVTGLSLQEIEARLSQPIYEVIERLETTVEGADGVRTWLDVYLPGDADEPVPVILVMTPYQSLGDAFAPLKCGPGVPQECPYNKKLVDYFVPRGYAVAFSDVRGNHNSGGCIDQTGPDQWQDGYNVVEWLGTQEWSSGRVGMYGASYDGESQISTALLNPPHLVTIVPTASVSNQYEYLYYDGVPYELQGASTMAAYLAISAVPGTDPNAVTTYPERLECQRENFEHSLDLSGDWNAYWEDRDYRVLAPNITASVLQIHGLQDWNVKPNHVDGFWNQLTTEKRLILGQWGHAYPDREDWELTLHRWFDHYLKGIDTGVLADLPPVLVEDDTGKWRGIDAFPPLDAAMLAFNLTPDGRLAPGAADEGDLTVHDYLRDAPGAGLAVERAGVATGYPPAAVAFETEPLDEDLRLTGRPLVRLAATTDKASTHWVAHLVEVHPDGTEETVNRGYLDTRHRDGVKDPKDLTPGERYDVTLRMFPQDTVLEKGHRLKLVLTNDDDWVHQDPNGSTSAIHLGPGGTALVLPLAPTGAPVPEDKLRPDL